VLGSFGDAASGQWLLPLGPGRIITQKQLRNAAGTGPVSRADIIIDNPSPRRRALWPDPEGEWTLAVDAYDLLTANQQAVLVPLAASGGTMSGPLADFLLWETRTVAPSRPGRPANCWFSESVAETSCECPSACAGCSTLTHSREFLAERPDRGTPYEWRRS
jgi:hypothetical protein